MGMSMSKVGVVVAAWVTEGRSRKGQTWRRLSVCLVEAVDEEPLTVTLWDDDDRAFQELSALAGTGQAVAMVYEVSSSQYGLRVDYRGHEVVKPPAKAGVAAGASA